MVKSRHLFLTLAALALSTLTGCQKPVAKVAPPAPTVGVVESRRMSVPVEVVPNGTTRALEDVTIRARVRRRPLRAPAKNERCGARRQGAPVTQSRGADNRHNSRFPLRLSAEVHYAGKVFTALTRDLSVGGLCLESEKFPNAINVPAWKDTVILKPGQTYRHTMVHAFSAE